MLLDEHVRDICFVLLTGIGDVVHGLPVANALKEDDPARRITWVAEPAPARVLQHHPAIDHVIVFHKAAGLAGVQRLQRDFRGRRFDLTLNMQRHLKGVFPTVFSGAPTRVGLDPEKVREGVWRFSNYHIDAGPWAHTQDLLLRFLDRLDVSRPDPLEWRITFSAGELSRQEAFFAALPRSPVIGLVLGSNVASKDWPAERYTELCRGLADAYDPTILLIGGPGARERAVAEHVLKHSRSAPISTLADDVRKMMWTVAGCDLVISPDSGPLHLAHAMGVPVVGLYGFTSPARFGPYQRFRELVIDAYHDADEEVTPTRKEARGGRMKRIAVEQVLERVELAVNRYGILSNHDRAAAEEAE